MTISRQRTPPASGDVQASWKDPAAVAAGTWTNYDVATANQMLDAAGLKRGSDGTRLDPDGKPMEYQLIVPSGWTDWISACQIISQNMSALGIKVDVQTPEQDTWTDTVAKGQFQWTLDTGDLGPTPYNFYLGQMSKLTVQPIGQSTNDNFDRYVSPAADKILAQFGQTADPALQKQYRQPARNASSSRKLRPCRSSRAWTGTSTAPPASPGSHRRIIPTLRVNPGRVALTIPP